MRCSLCSAMVFASRLRWFVQQLQGGRQCRVKLDTQKDKLVLHVVLLEATDARVQTFSAIELLQRLEANILQYVVTDHGHRGSSGDSYISTCPPINRLRARLLYHQTTTEAMTTTRAEGASAVTVAVLLVVEMAVPGISAGLVLVICLVRVAPIRATLVREMRGLQLGLRTTFLDGVVVHCRRCHPFPLSAAVPFQINRDHLPVAAGRRADLLGHHAGLPGAESRPLLPEADLADLHGADRLHVRGQPSDGGEHRGPVITCPWRWLAALSGESRGTFS
ncbi:unnamed protein product [Prorocentrum cordatum]|uniref:Uncharacterized protein n=1 Tax=Prorocentrum cordatum TaxID=2364126 RepID=A0ABN9YB50_9DINO|nr:unnamed protein product [Polarella glacialis]